MFTLRRINKILTLYRFIFDPDIDAFLLIKRNCDFLGDTAVLLGYEHE